MKFLTALVPLLLVAQAPAQQLLSESTLRADVEQAEIAAAGSTVRLVAQNSSHAVFASDGWLGGRLWVTDGTPAGTLLIEETVGGLPLDAGEVGSNPAPFGVALGDGTFFVIANVGNFGAEPVRVDPVAGTATFVADLCVGSFCSSPSSLVEFGGEAYFLFFSVGLGVQAYRSDGTTAGTEILSVLPAGTAASFLVAGPNHLFLLAEGSAPGMYSYTPGASSAQFLVSGNVGDPVDWYSERTQHLGSQLLIPFDDGIHGIEPWVTDGTPAGTTLLADLASGPDSSVPDFLSVNGGTALFAAIADPQGREFFLTDGTTGGTQLLQDIDPQGGGAFVTEDALAFGSGFLFGASAPGLGYEPWISGVTPGSATLLADLKAGPGSSLGNWSGVVHQGSAYFRASSATEGFGLYSTDGTGAGTGLVLDFVPGLGISQVEPLASLPAGLFLTGELQDGSEPLISDGTLAGTSQLVNSVPDPSSGSSFPVTALRAGSRVYFEALTAAFGRRLYAIESDTPGATFLEPSASSSLGSNPQLYADVGGKLLYGSRDAGTGPLERTLRVTEGVPGGSVDLLTFQSLGPQEPFGVLNGIAYGILTSLDGSRGLWRTDGTQAGTVQVDLGLEWQGSPKELVTFADQLWFVAGEPATGYELYRSDGTLGGTFLAADLTPGEGSSTLEFFTVAGDRLYVSKLLGSFGRTLYALDAAGNATVLADSLGTTDKPLALFQAADLGDRLVFSTRNQGSAFEPANVYSTDGTAAGTVLLGVFAAPSLENRTEGLVAASGVAFFWTRTGDVSTWDLWRTEGTPSSTWLLLEGAPVQSVRGGAALGSSRSAVWPLGVAGLDSSGVWRARDVSVSPLEWVSAYKGPQSTSVGSMDLFSARLGGELLFSANDGFTGQEVHSLPIVELGGFVTEPYGHGCGSAAISAAGEARVGETFSIDLAASPVAPAGLYVSDAYGYVTLAPGCAALLGSATLAANILTDASGQGTLSIPVPAQPSLAGARFFAQWATLTPGGPLLGLLELSDGLEVIVGG